MIPRIILIITAAVALCAFVFFLVTDDGGPTTVTKSFRECAALAGSVILESFPEQCRTSDGETFTNNTPIPVEPDGGIGDTKQFVGEGCVVAGCSGQLCVNASEGGVITTCEFRESYACYRTARCEKQAGDDCAWSQTPELTSCINEKSVQDFVPLQ